ncbi:MAG: Hsp70 family protein [Sarcina sp.]
MGRIIGIDLGTTTSEFAYIKKGLPLIINNDMGMRITPSVVGISDEGEFIVGEEAKRQAPLKPNMTAMEVKRLMGTEEMVKLGDKELSPMEVSSIILKHIKKCAENELGCKVDEAVITVPANFNDLQRQATKKAGEMAGFRVERIINEPTAAALAYGINNLDTEENVLVYDLGGGTFDVTVLELFDGVLDVLSSRGNNNIGGKDFDAVIENYIISDFKNKHGIDLSTNRRALLRIKGAAETAKINLSDSISVNINLPFIAIDRDRNPLEVNIELRREQFEKLISKYIEETKMCIDSALRAARLEVEDIDVVIAVGGSSRIPCVRRMLEECFEGKVKTELNMDEAVALGAAIQGGIKNDEIDSQSSVLITDACRYTLGISTVDTIANDRYVSGVFSPIIFRDSKIPCSEKKVYYTAGDFQSTVLIEVYEGDSKFVAENFKIGSFEIKNIPKAKAGEEPVEVKFTYNINGILEVEGKILSTGKTFSLMIDTNDISRELNDTSVGSWDKARLGYRIKNTVKLADKKCEVLDGEDKEKLEHLVYELKVAVVNDDEKLVEKYDAKIIDILFDLD